MNVEIILSLLSALCSLIGSLGGILVTSKLNLYRLEQLEKKVDKHNHLVERMYEIEKTVTTATSLYDEEIKVINHRISDLEQDSR
ncbi:Uncharacterised protein [uncultured Ruminococcus sp.]|uniref:hypothetical protein n=2 Tax=Pseudoruminococcus massiliensis TaxID=2086583 RepID=UPI000820D69A|nr:Uncharacterised protein [uncultured Ruminococcus sp.]SCJ81574.1 Uncharacterised protein [uncultured Ruminococcus sp.]